MQRKAYIIKCEKYNIKHKFNIIEYNLLYILYN